MVLKLGCRRPKRAIIISDIHSIFHDPKALRSVWRVAEEFEPEMMIVNGDLFDFYRLSRFDKDPRRGKETSILRERKVTTKIMERIDEFSQLPVQFTLGNHEDRLERYLTTKAPDIMELLMEQNGHKQAFCRMFRVPDEWHVHPYGRILQIGKLGVTHGVSHNSWSGNAARNEGKRAGGSLIMGHVHRLAQVPVTNAYETWWHYEGGHLSDPNPSYMKRDPDWQQGFACVTWHTGGDFAVELVPVHQGRALFRGERV